MNWMHFAGSGSDADRKREEKKKKKEEAKAKKAKRKESGGGEKKPRTQKTKKMTKLPGQPKKNMSAYFLWMQVCENAHFRICLIEN